MENRAVDELWRHARLSGFIRAGFGAKVKFVAAVGASVPMLAAAIFVLCHATPDRAFTLQLLLATLGTTAIGISLTLLGLNHLLRPIRLIAGALRDYIRDRTLPTLPLIASDEIGAMAADLTQVLRQLDAATGRLTQFDPATGLPSKEHLLRVLSERVASRGPFVLCAIAEHNHGRVRAVLGEQAADAVMRTLAQALLAAVGHQASVASVGPNELAFVLPAHVPTAAPILAALPSEVAVDGAICLPQLACGTARFPADADAPERLLNIALVTVPPAGAMASIAIDGNFAERQRRPAPA